MLATASSQAAGRLALLRRLFLSFSLASLVLVGTAATLPSAASAAEPGVNLLNLNVPSQEAAVSQLGTHWVRQFLVWPDLEPSRGVWAENWFAYYEGQFRNLPPGTKVILDVVGTPRWETGSADSHTPPANPAEFGAFVATVAKRFGPRVAAYEIWNEEDAPGWWAGGPDPAAYTRLLQATYPQVKAAEPNATVVLGGLTGNDFSFVEGVYQAGGKGSFDAVGVHTDTACNKLSPYTFLRGTDNRLITDSFLAYREVHAVMMANGDNKPIWMTELSWRTTEATCAEGHWAGQTAAGVSEAQQATYLSEAYHCMAQDPYVQVALWFPIQDEGGLFNGLMRANGSHKPSFDAMRSFATEGDKLTEPCGVFTGPTITVASPLNRVNYEGTMPIKVSATSSQGVFRIRLLIDGKLIRNYDGPSYPTKLSGEINWIGARYLSRGHHVLTFLAFDKMRNVSQVSVSVYHGKPSASHKVKRKSRRHGLRRH
jgi:hypothetical protein